MKNFLVLSIMTISFAASASDTTLLSLRTAGGFTRNGFSSQIAVLENGDVVKTVTTFREATRQTVAKLSQNSVDSLKEKIAAIEDDAKLVDPNPKAPRCMDAPGTSVEVNKGGKSIKIEQRMFCHTLKVETSEADALRSLIEGLNSL